MIKYQLRCKCEHEFEGWFPDSKEYKRQKNKGMINCPMCDSTAVDKAIMAPNVKTSKKKEIPEFTNPEEDPYLYYRKDSIDSDGDMVVDFARYYQLLNKYKCQVSGFVGIGTTSPSHILHRCNI